MKALPQRGGKKIMTLPVSYSVKIKGMLIRKYCMGRSGRRARLEMRVVLTLKFYIEGV